MAGPFPNPKWWQCQSIQQTETARKHKSYYDVLTFVAEGKTRPSNSLLNQLRTWTMAGPATAKSLLDLERWQILVASRKGSNSQLEFDGDWLTLQIPQLVLEDSASSQISWPSIPVL